VEQERYKALASVLDGDEQNLQLVEEKQMSVSSRRIAGWCLFTRNN
jgi:hypothetical protein